MAFLPILKFFRHSHFGNHVDTIHTDLAFLRIPPLILFTELLDSYNTKNLFQPFQIPGLTTS